jgi:integrase
VARGAECRLGANVPADVPRARRRRRMMFRVNRHRGAAVVDVATYIEERQATHSAPDVKQQAFLFRTSRGHGGTALADQPMTQVDAWRMVRKRAIAAGILAPIGNHSFRATGITAYLANGGTLEHAQSMAAHESPRTTKLYDRTKERLTLDEVERISL